MEEQAARGIVWRVGAVAFWEGSDVGAKACLQRKRKQQLGASRALHVRFCDADLFPQDVFGEERAFYEGRSIGHIYILKQ